MKILSNVYVHCREFGSALFSVADFNAWLQKNQLRIATVPDINLYDFVQIENLLCAVESAAGDISNDEAREIVDADDFLKADRMAELNPRWLVGAEAHRKWRVRLNVAVNAGELVPLDFGSKLPMVLPVSPGGALPGSVTKPANNWNEHGLQRLLSESREPGMTQQKLAKKYKLSRQRIAALLKKAKPKKPDAFSAFARGNSKK